AGTSSRSSKLVHGGLRYLEQAEFGLVHEAMRERGLLARRLAPHLVRPLPILVPLPAGPLPARAARRLWYGAGLALYDALAGPSGGMPRHRHLSRTGARRAFPGLRPDALTGAIRYVDAQVDDARLVVTLARTAASLGAAVVTSARVVVRRGRPYGGRRHRGVERRHRRHAARDPAGAAGAGQQGGPPRGAAVGDRRRHRSDPAGTAVGPVRPALGWPLDHRHHGHRL